MILGAIIGAMLALVAGGAHAWLRRRGRGALGTLAVWVVFGAVIGGVVGSRVSASGEYRDAMAKFTPIESEQQFDELVLEADVPVLVEFHTPGCVYCRQLAPTLGKLADAYKGSVRFVSVDGSRLGGLVRRYDVGGYPTVLVFSDGGQVKAGWPGVTEESVFREALDAMLHEAPPANGKK